MEFSPERLILARKALGINKAEAARRLNMSAMGYGRYEKGERMPSYQTISFIAQNFNTSIDYLLGKSEDTRPESFVISKETEPELYHLIEIIKKDQISDYSRLLNYLSKSQK